MTANVPINIASSCLHVTVLPRGAALVGVRLSGLSRNLVLGFANPDDHLNCPVYAGTIVGPVANRLRGGRFEHGGNSWQMPLNEAGRNTLHSGPDGLHAQIWQITGRDERQVVLTCTLPHGACGLPGHRRFEARYEVRGNCLRLTLRATTDAPSPVNLAAHPYWNLDGLPDVSAHHLHVLADSYLPTDDQNLPLDSPAQLNGGMFDFTAPRRVPLSPELDVNYCLTRSPRHTPQTAATLTGGDGTRLDIRTTAPGLQIYNGAHLPENAPQTSDFPVLKPYAAIALEPQHWPDAPNHYGFPPITLLPGQPYVQQTDYDFLAG